MKTAADRLMDWIVYGTPLPEPVKLRRVAHIPVEYTNELSVIKVHNMTKEDRQAFEDDMAAEGQIMEQEDE